MVVPTVTMVVPTVKGASVEMAEWIPGEKSFRENTLIRLSLIEESPA